MTWGPCLTRHASWPEARRRRIVAQGACNRPAVTRPSTFAATSGQEGEPPHKECAIVLRLFSLPSSPQLRSRRRTTAQGACNRPAVARPLSFATTGGPTSGMGPRPTCHTPDTSVPGCRKDAPPLAPMSRLLEDVAKDYEDNFSKPMQRLEAPRAWPNKDIKYGGHGPVSRGGRRGSRCDHRRAGGNCINGCAGAASRSPVKLWPHLQARIVP
jgi:hypothetical protein